MRFERVPIIARLTTLSYGHLSIVKCNAWTSQADHSQPVPSQEFVTMADRLSGRTRLPQMCKPLVLTLP